MGDTARVPISDPKEIQVPRGVELRDVSELLLLVPVLKAYGVEVMFGGERTCKSRSFSYYFRVSVM